MNYYTIEDETGMTVATAADARELHSKYQAGTKVFRSQVIRDHAGKRVNLNDLERLAGWSAAVRSRERATDPSMLIG